MRSRGQLEAGNCRVQRRQHREGLDSAGCPAHLADARAAGRPMSRKRVHRTVSTSRGWPAPTSWLRLERLQPPDRGRRLSTRCRLFRQPQPISVAHGRPEACRPPAMALRVSTVARRRLRRESSAANEASRPALPADFQALGYFSARGHGLFRHGRRISGCRLDKAPPPRPSLRSPTRRRVPAARVSARLRWLTQESSSSIFLAASPGQ